MKLRKKLLSKIVQSNLKREVQGVEPLEKKNSFRP